MVREFTPNNQGGRGGNFRGGNRGGGGNFGRGGGNYGRGGGNYQNNFQYNPGAFIRKIK